MSKKNTYTVHISAIASVHMVYTITALTAKEAKAEAISKIESHDEDFTIGEGGISIEWRTLYGTDIDYIEKERGNADNE